MAYGRSEGFKMGGSRKGGPGLSLKSDMKMEKMKGGKGKAGKAARKKV